MLVDITTIRVDGDTQSRERINRDVVDDYAEAMADGSIFPPVVLYQDAEGNLWISDGFHRLEAARSLGLAEIEAEIRHGSRRDAVLHSVGVNAHHGLQATRADRKRAVQKLLSDEEWAALPTDKIARLCGVTNTYVFNLKQQALPGMETQPECIESEQPDASKGRMICFRLSDREREQVHAKAKERGVSASELVMDCLYEQDVCDLVDESGLIQRGVMKCQKRVVPCPWHLEQTPSLAIDGKTGRFVCFGCGRSGTLADLVEEMDKVSEANDRKFKAALAAVDEPLKPNPV